MVKPNIAPKTQTAGFMVFTAILLLCVSTVVVALFLNRFQILGGQEQAPTRRIQDLVTLLNQAETRQETLESEVSRLRKKLLTLESDPKSSDPSTMDPELKRLYEMAGFTPVTGKGVRITLTDSASAKSAKDPHQDPNIGKLQAQDLLNMINELKAAGATAISINDQRVVATTEVVSSGPAISVNETRLTQPVVVRALGNPDVLVNALKIRGGILEYLTFFEIKVTVEKQQSVSLPPYRGPLTR